MSLIETQVTEEFLRQLSDDGDISDWVVEGLRSHLAAAQLPKAEDLAVLFATGSSVAST